MGGVPMYNPLGLIGTNFDQTTPARAAELKVKGKGMHFVRSVKEMMG